MDHNTIRSRLLERQADFGAVDLELVPLAAAAETTALRDGLAALPAVRDVGLLHSGLVSVAPGEAIAGSAQIYGLSPLPAAAFGHYRVEEGAELLDLDGDAQVLIGRELADAFRLRPGDRLRLQRPSTTPRAVCRGGRRVAIA